MVKREKVFVPNFLFYFEIRLRELVLRIRIASALEPIISYLISDRSPMDAIRSVTRLVLALRPQVRATHLTLLNRKELGVALVVLALDGRRFVSQSKRRMAVAHQTQN